MGWINTLELPDDRRGQVNYQAHREYQRTFQVQMGFPTDGSIQVSVAPGVPRIFDAYVDADGTFDLGARCYDVQARQMPESMLHWIVTCKYASGDRSRYSKQSPEKGDNRFNQQDPLQRPPIVIWGSVKFQKAIAIDTFGNPIINSAGDYFDPVIQRDDTRLTLTVIRNEPSYDPAVTIGYSDAINTDSFLGAPPYTAKFEERTGRSNVENNQVYWEVTYQFHFRRWALSSLDNAQNAVSIGNDANGIALPGYVRHTQELGWLQIIRDEGFYQYDQFPNPTQRFRILDSKSQPVVTPKPLATTGLPVAPGGTVGYYVYHVYPEMQFAVFGLTPQ